MKLTVLDLFFDSLCYNIIEIFFKKPIAVHETFLRWGRCVGFFLKFFEKFFPLCFYAVQSLSRLWHKSEVRQSRFIGEHNE